MNQSKDDNEVRRHIGAFADGELDVQQSLRVLERMALDPQTTKRVLHQQQLRQRAAQVMRTPNEAPDALRRQIEALAASAPGTTTAPSASAADHRSVKARLGGWLSMAAAVALAVGLTLALTWPEQQQPWRADASLVLTGAQAETLGARHVRCSRGVDELLNTARFPDTVRALPGALEGYFGQPMHAPPLDLSVLGYEYVHTGECHLLGEGAVHVMYEARPETGRRDALSLWIRPNDGGDSMGLELEPGRLYVGADAPSPHPMLLWQADGMIYCLAGDAMPHVERVATHLRRQASAAPLR